MPAVVPLHNIKLQNSLNLNSQSVTGGTPAKRFVFKAVASDTPKVIDVSDMGRMLQYSDSNSVTLNANITGVVAGDTFTVTAPSAGSAVGNATIINSFSDTLFNSVRQFIYIGNNTWIVLNTN
jgi:hypothetical protein